MRSLLAGLLFISVIANVSATLIGDTVTVQRAFPTSTAPDPRSLESVVVTAGTSDKISYYSNYSVDFEADSLLISNNIIGWYTGIEFNGLFIDDLNDSSGLALTGVTVTTSIANFEQSMVSFDADSIWLNFIKPYSFELGVGDLSLQLQFGDSSSNSVPESSSLVLLAFGLLGLFGAVRRKV